MGRHLDERLALRAPRLYRRLMRLVMSLPPGSPVRRRLLKRAISRGFEAVARQDFAIFPIAYDPDVEINIIGEEMQALGLAGRYHGHEELIGWLGAWTREWVDARNTPELMLDLGDRLVVRVKYTARGAASGAEVTQSAGHVYYSAGGVFVRQDQYWSWSECVEALALDDVAPAVRTERDAVPTGGDSSAEKAEADPRL
jgi:ketosteroid isomerase-like protein